MAAAGPFGGLADRLIRDGFDTVWIRTLFSDPQCEFLPAIAQINLKHHEDTAAYGIFLEEKNIAIAENYLTKFRPVLEQFHQKTAVPPEVVVAILLIETKCGLDREKAPVMNVLASISVCSEKNILDAGFRVLQSQFPDVTRMEIRRRSRLRSRWGYKELRAFLKWAAREKVDRPLAIRGSWAGAWGLPQFVPSSLAAYAADGNQDGRIDLNEDVDAIASICNYLKKNGWKAGKSPAEQRRVIWRYNHSPLYVDTVLDVAERIRNP